MRNNFPNFIQNFIVCPCNVSSGVETDYFRSTHLWVCLWLPGSSLSFMFLKTGLVQQQKPVVKLASWAASKSCLSEHVNVQLSSSPLHAVVNNKKKETIVSLLFNVKRKTKPKKKNVYTVNYVVRTEEGLKEKWLWFITATQHYIYIWENIKIPCSSTLGKNWENFTSICKTTLQLHGHSFFLFVLGGGV